MFSLDGLCFEDDELVGASAILFWFSMWREGRWTVKSLDGNMMSLTGDLKHFYITFKFAFKILILDNFT